MTQVRFGDKDRQRWDLPEWVEWDPFGISIKDLTELSERHQFELEDWPRVLVGELTLEQAGDPDATPKRPRWVPQTMAWMVLHQNDRAVSWDEAGEAAVLKMLYRTEEQPGKDDESSTPLDGSEPSTTPPSESSST